jgi:hypothetical protein
MRHSNVVVVNSSEVRVILQDVVVPSCQGYLRALPTNQYAAAGWSGHARTIKSFVRYAPSLLTGTFAARSLARSREHRSWMTVDKGRWANRSLSRPFLYMRPPATPASRHLSLRLFRRFPLF